VQEIIDIGWGQLGVFGLILVVPLTINHYYQLNLGRDIVLGVGRMTIQLCLVGVYLEYLFSLNSLTINLLWLVLMVMVGASAILSKSRLPKRVLMGPVSAGLMIGLAPLLLILCLAVVQPTPLYSAQYVIPLSGMLLGNSLSGNIVALQNLFSAYEERKMEYEAAISLGASPYYASRPFVQNAMQKALAPILASMTTMGLVTLPGMMTGQILSGASPMVAIKYQLMIMIAIFTMMSISLTLCIQFTQRKILTKEGRVSVSFLKR